MSRAAFVLSVLLAVAVPGEAWALPGARDRWRGPLAQAETIGAFDFDPAAPYARGARRGLDLRARPGAPTLAVCHGTVRFAGPVPGRGLGVTLACGGLRATELGLASVTVRPGARVRAGAPIGRLGAAGILRLGARRADQRHGYVDPAPLLASTPPPAMAPPPARPTARRVPPPVAVRRTTPPRAPRASARLPWPAWAALALVITAVAGGTVSTRRRQRETRTRMRVAHRYR